MASSTNTGTHSDSVLSELLFTGRRFHADPEHTKYVCHTSTIPLATTVDNQSILEDWAKTTEVSHSIKYQPGYDQATDYRCCKKHCMYVGRQLTYKEILRDNCPCSKIVREEIAPDGEPMDIFLQPLCFLQVIKELRYRFGYTDSSAHNSEDESVPMYADGTRLLGYNSNRPKLDLTEVMFCQNADAITDETFSKPLRERVGFSGWSHANSAHRIAKLMDQLYWFRRYVRDNTRTYLSLACERDGPIPFRRVLEQCLHTLNGAIIKKLLLFPCEMEGYRKLAQLTASLFSELIRDYLRPPREDDLSDDTSLFTRMKRDMNEVKSRFPSDDPEHRFSVFHVFGERRDAWARFWGGCFSNLRKRAEGLDRDYTKSPAFIYTMSGWAQTRNLGHLPKWVAEIKRKAFRLTISRERDQIPLANVELIMKLIVRQANKAGIEPGFLRVTSSPATLDFKEVLSHLEIPLKPTASVTSTVSMGGKVEDARRLFEDACKYSWAVPIRDFETGQEIDSIQFSPELRKKAPGYQGHLFWLSLQLLINSHHEHEPRLFLSEYKPLSNSREWLDTMYRMSIVHISEPGKERNLTKTSSVLAWVLTVASKVSQGILSFAQDHRAGLILSAQDWMHQRRVSGESFESEWLYDPRTRLRREAWNGFQDWTQSTDFISRRVGLSALRAWFSYVAFPKWFAHVILWSTQRDYTVSEVIGTKFGSDEMEPVLYNGFVREGWMMSMPLTKTVLHLMHDVNVGLVEATLERHGVRVADRPLTKRVDVERDRLGPFYVSPPKIDE